MKRWNIVGLIVIAALIIGAGVVIVSQSAKNAIVQVTELKPETDTLSLRPGENETIIVAVLPKNATDRALIWTSSDENIATVDNGGVVKAVTEGECIVKVSSSSNASVSAEIKITVYPVPQQSGDIVEPDDITSDTQIEEPEEPEEPEIIDEAEEEIPETGDIVLKVKLDRYETTIDVGQIDMPWVTMLPQSAQNKGEIWTSDNPRIASVDAYGRITGVSAGETTITVKSSANPEAYAEMKVKVNPAPAVTSPTYIDGILIANKSYPLPSNYNPGEDPEAAAALQKMISGAANDGIELYKISGFRSFETQQNLYSKYLLREGREAADRYSARPGYSEHQSGLSYDLNSLEFSFGETKEGIWLKEHCAEYGFIIRYPEGKEDITGYMYEPWHVRYLGVDTAKKVSDSGLTLEEYLGIKSEYAY